MTKKRNTKSALISSVLVLVLCCSMLVGTTFAWFTDNATSGSNVIQTGNLDIEVEYTLDGETWNALDGATDLFQKGLWEPGHTEVVALKITNKGSLALKYIAQMNIMNEIVGKNKDGEDIVLSEILQVATITHQVNVIGDILLGMIFNGANNTDPGSITTFSAANILGENQELLSGDSHYLIVTVDMPETVGNEANHNGVNIPSIEFGINVLATQFSYENDSFGNQYDANAEFDKIWGGVVDTTWYNADATEFTIENANQLAGLAKLVNTGVDTFAGKNFKLADDIDLNNVRWFPIGNSSGYNFGGTFDGQGYTVSNIKVAGDNGNAGLFGYVAGTASISNLKLNNVAITDSDPIDNAVNVGAVVGYAAGAVKLNNIEVTGNIQIDGDWYTSALIGRSKGATISNCSVIANDGSFVSSDRWASGLSGYDNGAMKLSGCAVENLEIKANSYAGGVAALGAAGANVNGNSVKNVSIVIENVEPENVKTYGTILGGNSVYSYSTTPIYLYDNTVDGTTCTVNGTTATAQESGSKYADGTDQGLIMMPTVKVGNAYYTYLKNAVAKAAKDGTQTVIELTGDTMITAKFKPSVAKGQNIVIKTNGYNLIWVEQDASKLPVTDAEGNLVTTIVTAENMSSYIKVANGGTIVIE